MPAKRDLTGQKFGRWTVLRRDKTKPKGQGLWWVVRCSCPAKTQKSLKGGSLTHGSSKSCGCLKLEVLRLNGWVDHTGDMFGHWRVLSYAGTDKYGRLWLCECDCVDKTQKVVAVRALTEQYSTHCGCLTGKHLSDAFAKKRPRGETGLLVRWRQYRTDAKKSRRAWKLSKKLFRTLVESDCFYCGRPPEEIPNAKVVHIHSRKPMNGIDRVDNKKGYFRENCVPCCKWCNYIKRNLTLRAFAAHVQRLTEMITKTIFADQDHVYKEWLAKLAARNNSVAQRAA